VFLYYITDRKQLSADPQESVRLLLERIRAAAEAGIDAIQLREKDLTAKVLLELATRVKEIVDEANLTSPTKVQTRLLINSRVDVALACGCDGVHLRSDDISPADARVVFHKAGVAHPLIAVSCHVLSDVELAAGNGADTVVFGPIFGKVGQQHSSSRLDDLRDACNALAAAKCSMPLIALGAVTEENAMSCIRVGASGVAGVRLFQTGNLQESVCRLRKCDSPNCTHPD
jgi:thiamine-phosphate pyrophosphorylase